MAPLSLIKWHLMMTSWLGFSNSVTY